ncbi:MAG: hypothetical protein KAT70_03530 [Thermoplasmata archaeon]|nr:hypothetical protein [Thermoplasmata archaeon]
MEDVETGISGLDAMLSGGLPHGGLYLVSGGTGAGKTIMGLQYCIRGAEKGENSLFITLEENKEQIALNAPEDMRKRMKKLQKDLYFLDFTALRTLSSSDEEITERGALDVTVLSEILQRWSEERNLKRCVIDGIASIGVRYKDTERLRSDIFRLGQVLKRTGVTSIITIEASGEFKLSRYGVEEYISDGVILLSKEGDRRHMEIVKMRGKGFPGGAQEMEILSDGVHVYAKKAYARSKKAPRAKESFGIKGVDTLLGGGISEGDVTLVSGSPGSGKSLFGLHFLKPALTKKKKVLYVTFKESRAEIIRSARQWGLDLEGFSKQGLADIIDPSIVDLLPGKHLEEMRRMLRGTNRVVIDAINDYEKALMHPKDMAFREYIEHMIGIFKESGTTALILSDSSEIMGAAIPGERYTMYLADNVILLRYVEDQSQFKRAISVLKKRRGTNSREIREFYIEKNKIVIGGVFEGITGVMSGKASRSDERVEKFFS